MKSEETCHFWLGHFSNEERLGRYFEEDYDQDDDDTPVSEFARDQQENWYDHDFLEVGFASTASSIKELVQGYSYHEQYEDELTNRAMKLPIQNVNTFVFISEEEIGSPRTVETEEFCLYYVGTITYRI